MSQSVYYEWREHNNIPKEAPLTEEQYRAYLSYRGITAEEDSAEVLEEVLTEYQQETGRTHGFWKKI